MRYTKEFGNYYLRDERGIIRFMSDSIAILFDKGDDGTTLLKHGRPDSIEKHHQRYAELQRLHPDIFDIRVIISDQWDVEELNKLIECSGYIDRFIDALQFAQLSSE